MNNWSSQFMPRRKSPMQQFTPGSPILTFFSTMGLILFGAIAIPVLVGLISAIPDIARYLKMRSM